MPGSQFPPAPSGSVLHFTASLSGSLSLQGRPGFEKPSQFPARGQEPPPEQPLPRRDLGSTGRRKEHRPQASHPQKPQVGRGWSTAVRRRGRAPPLSRITGDWRGFSSSSDKR
ncbi:hypothetical protein NDU88_002825 [Pleurodeles waltl]|uniref:Uncharacterized protein n=1 Tax=Pleurodeles waltl TaxID=8319 RepID=A0AAV7WR10_PLEWA|nr:hypothetical protein NDU88_002825 [Pleurodeles waltl]